MANQDDILGAMVKTLQQQNATIEKIGDALNAITFEMQQRIHHETDDDGHIYRPRPLSIKPKAAPDAAPDVVRLAKQYEYEPNEAELKHYQAEDEAANMFKKDILSFVRSLGKASSSLVKKFTALDTATTNLTKTEEAQTKKVSQFEQMMNILTEHKKKSPTHEYTAEENRDILRKLVKASKVDLDEHFAENTPVLSSKTFNGSLRRGMLDVDNDIKPKGFFDRIGMFMGKSLAYTSNITVQERRAHARKDLYPELEAKRSVELRQSDQNRAFNYEKVQAASAAKDLRFKAEDETKEEYEQRILKGIVTQHNYEAAEKLPDNVITGHRREVYKSELESIKKQEAELFKEKNTAESTIPAEKNIAAAVSVQQSATPTITPVEDSSNATSGASNIDTLTTNNLIVNGINVSEVMEEAIATMLDPTAIKEVLSEMNVNLDPTSIKDLLEAGIEPATAPATEGAFVDKLGDFINKNSQLIDDIKAHGIMLSDRMKKVEIDEFVVKSMLIGSLTINEKKDQGVSAEGSQTESALPDLNIDVDRARKTPGTGKLGKLARLGKAGLGIVGKVAAPIAAVMTLSDAVSGYTNAAENLGIEGREATFGEKLSSSLGSAVSGLSFGLIDEKNASKGIANFFGQENKT